jgi:hypothetical protein
MTIAQLLHVASAPSAASALPALLLSPASQVDESSESDWGRDAGLEDGTEQRNENLVQMKSMISSSTASTSAATDQLVLVN